LVVLDHVLHGERVELELLLDVGEVLLRGVHQVDPDEPVIAVEDVRDVLGVLDLLDLAVVVATHGECHRCILEAPDAFGSVVDGGASMTKVLSH
jgi:hypothetical protein